MENIIIEKTEEKTIAQMLTELKLAVGDSYYFNEEIEATEMFSCLNSGIYTGENGYYLVVKKGKQDSKSVCRVSNFTLGVKNKVVSHDFNHENDVEYKYEICVKTCNKEIDVTIGSTELQSLKRFEQKLSAYAHVITIMDDKQHKNLMAKILSENEKLEEVIEFKTAGYNRIKGKEYFIASNINYLYNKQSKNNNLNIRLSKNAALQPVFASYNDNTGENNYCEFVSSLLKDLFNTIEKAYNQRIEPYLALSMAPMTLFLKQISNDFEGTPIISLYGEAASGKSNLLRLIASMFGLDKSVLHGGMDTTAGIIEDLENYVNIPLLVDEVELCGTEEIKRLIKSVYGQTGRKKFNCKNNINTTLFFNTNNVFLHDLEYKNRCIELNFEQVNFNCFEAEKFNYSQQYLSCIARYIIENVNYSEIKILIKENEQSDLLKRVEDIRTKRNLAIAIAGLKLLIDLIDSSSGVCFEQFEERLQTFVAGISCSYNNDVYRFIAILKELLNEKYCKLNYKTDYKITNNGIHIVIGRNNETFSMHFKNMFNRFYKGIKPLQLKNYQKLLLQQGAEMKNMYYSSKINSQYGIFLPFDKFKELAYLAENQSCNISYIADRQIIDEKSANVF